MVIYNQGKGSNINVTKLNLLGLRATSMQIINGWKESESDGRKYRTTA